MLTYYIHSPHMRIGTQNIVRLSEHSYNMGYIDSATINSTMITREEPVLVGTVAGDT